MIVRGACPHDCPDTCAWEVEVRDGVALSVRGVKDHPFTRGGLCAKVNDYEQRAYSPDRVLTPLRRTGRKGEASFEPISWDDALDEVAGRLRDVIDRHGAEAILPYSYMGTQGLVQGATMDRRLFGMLGASRLERTVCGATAAAGVSAAIGSTKGLDPEELEHSRLIVLWGTNTIVTNLHLWPVIRRARDAGARIVVIDPLRTRTATAADQHIRPLPGTDAALALGMAHVILAEDLHDADYVERHCTGFEVLAQRAAAWPPQRAAQACGVPAAEIAALGRDFATTRPAAIRRLIGMEHHEGGGAALRAIACLPGLVGAWRDRGGGLCGTTAWAAWMPLDIAALTRPDLHAPGTRAVNMIQLGRALTELDDPPVKALVVHGSNPAAIAPDQERVRKGLEREDLFCVVAEHFLTDTARHADIVLPATTQLEHLDLVPSWGHMYITLNRPAIAPVGDARPNSEIFRGLAGRLGLDHPCFADSDEDLIRQALGSGHPLLDGITYERLERDGWARVGVAPGARPFAQGGFDTPTGRCDLALDDFRPAREGPLGDPELRERFPLALLTAKSALHFLNSSYANMPRHLRAEREPLLEIHPDDAASRNIADGDWTETANDRGTVRARARVSGRVRPGVVSLPSGWWPSLSPGGTSANALTSDALADMGGGGAFHSTLVDVRAAPDAD